MACSTIEFYEQKSPSLWSRLKFALAGLRGGDSYSSLDFETMPDHMMRDLGFLDGRDPRYEDERWR